MHKMKTLLIVASVLALALPAFAQEIEGAFVDLVDPAATELLPGEVMTMEFIVQNDSQDAEWITDVHIAFPDGFVLYPATMGYDEIVAGRPSWTMFVPPVDHTAIWEDNNGGYGEVWSTESTLVRIDVLVADVLWGCIYWHLWGDEWGADPHDVCGCIDIGFSPVRDASWSSIKALYQ
jgi:hypothetical protein